MISAIFYLFYFVSTLSIPVLFFNSKYRLFPIYILIFDAQFNVTAFFRFGIVFSFFEIALFLIFFCVLLSNFRRKDININYVDRVFAYFLVFSLISIWISDIRINARDLIPNNYYSLSPGLRSLLSLNKIFIFFPILLILRNYYTTLIGKQSFKREFLKALVLSGILPCVAVTLQILNVGFILFHNNESYGEIGRLVNYVRLRPAGLANEASFFAYQLFFPFLSLFYVTGNFYRKFHLIVYIFFLLCIIFSFSRTGYVIFLFFILYRIIFNNKSLHSVIVKCMVLVVIGVVIYFGKVDQLGVVKRFDSSFQKTADLSNIERFGITQALFSLGIDKSMILGIGIYNYQYYIKKYLPSYMKVIYYDRRKAPSSFNFILELVVEFGLIFFFIFLISILNMIIKSRHSLVRNWFLFLFLFGLTFQILNFSVPFLIILFPLGSNENSVYN